MNQLIKFILAILLIALIVVCAFGAGIWYEREATIEQGGHIEPEVAIEYLESCRDSHLYWAEHEYQANWVVVPGQDAKHAEMYDQIIELIKVLGGKE